MNILFIGYRGTGKTTVARLTAHTLNMDWIDADVELERRADKTIAEIFAESGEEGFRNLETELIRDLLSSHTDLPCQIIALGGGAVLRNENRELMRKGRVIWLRASPETIANRVKSDPDTAQRRPNLTASGGIQEITELLLQREPIYQACADDTVDTERKTPEQIAIEIAALVSNE